MRVALVHDDLVQWGGAERVLLGLSQIYPQAPIFTSVYDKDNEILNRIFSSKKITTSFLQKIPRWKNLYKVLLPFYPLAFEQFNFDDFDLVISHTTRFAKSIITKPQTKHICFCHTPPRFLWHFSKVSSFGIGEILMTKLRLYDQISAGRVDYFIAGSVNAKRRIKKIYKRDSKVVYPFIDMEKFKGVDVFDGGYYVVVGRPTMYKRFDLARKACSKLNLQLKIIDGSFTDEMVVNILAGCKALILVGEEDFGIASLEAQVLGKPVIAFRAGGALETVIENKTGIFFNLQSEDCLAEAIRKLDSVKINSQDCKENASRFSKEHFFNKFKQTVASL